MNEKHNIIFCDTETTGNTEKDFLCQIAYKTDKENFAGLYKPPVKIPPEASAVHHITNKMIADKPAFQESEDYKKIKELPLISGNRVEATWFFFLKIFF